LGIIERKIKVRNPINKKEQQILALYYPKLWYTLIDPNILSDLELYFAKCPFMIPEFNFETYGFSPLEIYIDECNKYILLPVVIAKIPKPYEMIFGKDLLRFIRIELDFEGNKVKISIPPNFLLCNISINQYGSTKILGESLLG